MKIYHPVRAMQTLQLLAGLCGGACLCGCVSTPPPQDGTPVSAYSVGDRARVALDEVVISLPFRNATEPYQNLHVGLAALVNPKKTTLSNPYQAGEVIRRVETRLAARLTEELSKTTQWQSLETTPALRLRITTEAQAVVEQALQQWEHGADYRVEIVVVSLYWTNPSVGRGQAQRGWW